MTVEALFTLVLVGLGVMIGALHFWLSRRQVAEQRAREAMPLFKVDLTPAVRSDTNGLIVINCTSGSGVYELFIDILHSGPEDTPAVIGLWPLSDANVEVSDSPSPDIAKTYRLGTIRRGESRTYGLQPSVSIGSRDSKFARLVIRAGEEGGETPWSFLHLVPVQGYE